MTDGARRVKIEVLCYAFETLTVERVTAKAAVRNFASLRILRSSASDLHCWRATDQDCDVLSSANSLCCLGPQRGHQRNVPLLMKWWDTGLGRPQKKRTARSKTLAKSTADSWRQGWNCWATVLLRHSCCLLPSWQGSRPGRRCAKGTGSYWVKHIAENFACSYPEGEKLGPRYVSNGVLIAAAIHAGLGQDRTSTTVAMMI